MPFKTPIYLDKPHTLHSLMEKDKLKVPLKNKTVGVEKETILTTTESQNFSIDYLSHLKNESKNSTSIINDELTDLDPKDKYSLASVFNYLFTADNEETFDRNTLYSNQKQNESIPIFKNISSNIPSFDEWLVKPNKSEINTTSQISISSEAIQTTTLKILPSSSTTASSIASIPVIKLTTTKRPLKITTTTQKPTTKTTKLSTTIKITSTPKFKQEIKYPVQYPNIDNKKKVPVVNSENKINSFDQKSQHNPVGTMEILTKPTLPGVNGLLKLAGCNIYGRMYSVHGIIAELSSPCLECKCTEIGVNCTPLKC